MSADAFLRMEGINKRYGGTVALKRVSVAAELGEVHALVGENGAGKSTLMNILSGAVSPDSGSIFLGQQTVTMRSPHQANALGVRAVHQEFSLVPHLTIAENILMGKLPTQGGGRVVIDWPKAYERARALLAELGFSGLDERARVHHLSTSQQQVVEIAKALAEKPKILILDEPSAVLSKDELSRLFALIRRLKGEKTLILYISHRLEEVFEIADRITVLRDGEVVGTVRREAVDQNDLIRMMVGRSFEEIYPRRGTRRGDEVLSVHGLGREGEFRDVDFTLHRGEVLGMFGLVGSGRSSLARSVFGAEPPTSGSIRVDGLPLRLRTPREAVSAGISLVTEDRKRDGLVMHCTIRDNVSFAAFPKMSRGIFLNRKLQERLVAEKVKELALKPPHIGALVRTLSGGNQQKVILAKWLLCDTKVLLLDEPTRGVDIGAKVEIYHLINALVEAGVGVLLISSEMLEVLGMSDRILVMREGRLVGDIDREKASEEGLLQLAAGVEHATVATGDKA
ncbi:MAG: sugar ABC transporter ATP-binding protein [Rectinemataceae bacterium]|jgi:ABC-type sugar transport system ATPase subunit